MNFGMKLKAYRDTYDLTQEEFARLLGTTKQVLSRYERGERVPKIDVAQRFAARMGVDINDLVDDNRMFRSGFYRIDHSMVSINVYGTVPAGIPMEAIEDIVDTEEIPADWCRGGKQYFGLRVKGDSMYPKYLDGDTIIVRKQEICESGCDCVVYVNGYEATLKQIKLGSDGSLTLLPQNTNYAPVTYTAQQVATLPIKIAGVVVELRRKMR